MNRIIRVGVFSSIGIALIVGFSIWVNDHPYWYRPCNEVKIHVDDATGLRRKSPVRTLGLEIGFINEVNLDGDRVLIKVCVTAPVKLNPETRAYVRSSGFLGDKFLELKPLDMQGSAYKPNPGKKSADDESSAVPSATSPNASTDKVANQSSAAELNLPKGAAKEAPTSNEDNEKPIGAPVKINRILDQFDSWITPTAYATEAFAEEKTLSASRESEISDTVKKVGKLVDQLTLMVGDLREVTQQKDFKEMVVNINQSMKHLEVLLRPTGKQVATLTDALESMKKTMAHAEAVMQKVHEGQGTIGKLINDDSLYEEFKSAVKSVNLLLGKAGALKTYIDMSAVNIPAYGGNKAKFSVMIAPNPTRYYLVGLSNEPRGRSEKTTTTTTVNGGPATVEVKNENKEKGLKITALFGKYFGPLELRAGLIEDDGGVGFGFWLDESRRFGVHADFYSPGKGQGMTARIWARAQVYSTVYLTGGVDSLKKYDDGFQKRVPYFVGAGLFFDDDDLKYLLAFK